MEVNIHQAREFLCLLTGNDEDPVTFQVFYDPKDGIKRPDLAKRWVANLDDSLEFLNWSQSQLCGVYVGLNVSDGIGFENSNIIKYRGLFADFDGMEEPAWALTPHFTQARDNTHGHAFWLVSDITTADEFKALQMRIAMYHGTDRQVHDPARIVRLAGFIHYKDPQNPAQYTVTDDNTDGDHKYTMQEIIDAFPLTAQQDAELTHWVESRGGLIDGSGYENDERYINQFRKWLADVAPVAVLGSGSHTVFKVAGYGHDHGIPLDTAQEIMWELYNPRCEPVWQLPERNHFYDIIERAYRYATSAAGCKTAKAGFIRLGAIPEPVGGWEANKKIGEANEKKGKETITAPTVEEAQTAAANDGRLTKEEASISLAQLNNKSSHYDLARAIDGILWNGNELMRAEKAFYQFDGMIWGEIPDELVKSQIQRFYSRFKPADSFVRGVYASLCDLVTVESKYVQNGKWIDGSGRNGGSIVVYKNGIVDLSDTNNTLEKHTRNFFTFNRCSYNYNPTADCPTWLSFLNSIWGDDEDLKKQLQEFMGYLMTDSADLQKFAVFMGLSRGGKGVLTSVIRELIGEDNTCAPPLNSLVKDAALHNMSSKALGLIPDAHSVGFSTRDSVLSAFKAITGGDPMTYDVKFKSPQTRVLRIKFILSTNNMPEFEDSSGALANRMLVFPFMKSFAGKEDPHLKSKLLAEIEGINQWALIGLARLRGNNGKFTESQAGLIEKEEIREDMFPLAKYVNTMCTVQTDAFTSISTLYAAYKLWCTMSGIKQPMTEIKFSKVLRCSELGLTKDRKRLANGSAPVRGFVGIRLSDDCMNQMSVGNVVSINEKQG